MTNEYNIFNLQWFVKKTMNAVGLPIQNTFKLNVSNYCNLMKKIIICIKLFFRKLSVVFRY